MYELFKKNIYNRIFNKDDNEEKVYIKLKFDKRTIFVVYNLELKTQICEQGIFITIDINVEDEYLTEHFYNRIDIFRQEDDKKMFSIFEDGVLDDIYRKSLNFRF